MSEHHHHDQALFARRGNFGSTEYDIEEHLVNDHGCMGLPSWATVGDYCAALIGIHTDHHRPVTPDPSSDP